MHTHTHTHIHPCKRISMTISALHSKGLKALRDPMRNNSFCLARFFSSEVQRRGASKRAAMDESLIPPNGWCDERAENLNTAGRAASGGDLTPQPPRATRRGFNHCNRRAAAGHAEGLQPRSCRSCGGGLVEGL